MNITECFTQNPENINILRLIRTENIGIKTFLYLMKLYGSATESIKHVNEFASKGGMQRKLKVYSEDDVAYEVEKINKNGAKLLTFKDGAYPNILLNIPDYPPVISVKGNIDLLNKKSVAVVGARNASLHGKGLARKIGELLLNNNIITVSGLARGIDTAAHSASHSNTMAVIAGGIDHVYPQENLELYNKIAKEGIIVAELKIGSKPNAQHFPQRNRIISGITIATVVVEAALNSGSLITARLASEYGREVFAIPGFPLDPRSQGTNRLIKEGAYLVESIDEIITNLPNYNKLREPLIQKNDFLIEKVNEYQNTITNKMRNEVLNSISFTEISIDELHDKLDIPISALYMIIVELEIAGKILRLTNSSVVRSVE